MNVGRLTGRGVVVTGGGRGIGAAVASALSRAGAEVMVSARTASELDQVVANLAAAGGQAWAHPCDVTQEKSVKRLGEEARRRLGTVDLLINNAGTASSGSLKKLALSEWERVFAVNVTGTFLCTREFVPEMVERKWGRVVNVASVAGLEGARYVSHYSAAKHAVVGFTRAVALEVAGSGVTVNAVCPGYVATTMTDRTVALLESRSGLKHEDALRSILATTGQSRLVTPDEVAAEILKLCLEEPGVTNGQAIVLNPVEARR